MVGLCGVVGRDGAEVASLSDGLVIHGDEQIGTHRTENGVLRSVVHRSTPGADGEPSRAASGDVVVLLWGSLYGHERDGRYVQRRRAAPDSSPGAYLADLYERRGADVLDGVNGEYAAVIVDERDGTVSLVTDRLGSRALFYTTAEDGALVFSTAIQSLAADEFVVPAFDPEYLVEYLTYERAFGTKTPLKGVEKVPPGSVLTVDADGETVTERYWYPDYRPEERSLSTFVDELAARLRAALADRMADDATYGALLSGGIDSRLIVGVGDPDVAYHLSGWENREMRIAREVAETAGCPFRPLWRCRDYQAESLTRTPQLSNFIGGFDEGHATGFLDEIREEVDVLLSGHLSDTLFAGNYLPRRQFSVPAPGMGSFPLPILHEIDDVESYIDHRAEPAPKFLGDVPTPREVLERNVTATGDGIDHHGIHYRSMEELIVSEEYYPRTDAKPFFEYTTEQSLPLRKPFADNRLLDLHLRIPRNYLMNGNLVNRAMQKLTPSLARVPDANTGVQPRRSFAAHYAGELWTHVRQSYLPIDQPPEPHLSQGPWPNNAALIRTHEFVREALEEREEIARTLPELDADGAWECYHDHLDGDDKTQLLYPLLTLLSMPITETIARREREAEVVVDTVPRRF
jgi:asparagine synthase (glutamine-hydrolysing)